MRYLLKLKPYFIRYRKTIALGILSIILSTVFSVTTPMFIRDAIDGMEQNVSIERIIWYAVLVVIAAALGGAFLYMTRQTIIVVSRRMEYDMRNDFIAHIQRLPLRFFQNTPTGDIMAHATNDIGAVRMFVGPAVMYSTETLFSFFIILGLMLSIHPFLTLLALIPLPLISYMVNKLGNVIHKKYEAIQAHYSVLTAAAQENLAGARVVKAYGREQYAIDSFHELSSQYRTKNMAMVRLQALIMPSLGVLIGVSIIIVVWYGGGEVIREELTIGEMTQFMIYLGMLIWPMIAIGWVVSIIQRAAASMKRLQNILDVEPEVADTSNVDRSITALTGDIRFDEVTFRYREDYPEVLTSIDLNIPAGTTFAIVGYTGSGKSSLVNLIPRLYDATHGAVLIDGRDVRAIPLSVLRQSIAYVTQETFLFSDSIENNIKFGVDEATEEKVQWAAGIARIDKDVADFPEGYKTMLGERGITLSGGQKQRISIARALMREPSILVLDDAFSAVDTNTEEEILSQLREVMKQRTSIIISHRISTVRNADKIIVLHEGRIQEQGTHDELVAFGGIYADLHQKQLLAEEIAELE